MAQHRTDITNKEQEVFETAEFEGGVPVFQDGTTRVVSKGRGASQRVAAADGSRNSNAGVVMPHSSKPGLMTAETIGRA